MSNSSNFIVGSPFGVLNLDGSFSFSQSNNALYTGTGNVTVTSNLTIGNLNNNSNAVSFIGPSTGQYKLTMPSINNTSNTLPYGMNSLTISQNGQASFSPAEFIGVQNFTGSNGVYSAPTLLTNTMMVTIQTYTQANGLIQVFPTTTGASSGTPVFNKILSVTGLIFNNSQLLSGVTLIAGSSISSDMKTINLSAVQSTSIILGGSTLSPAPSGLSVQVTIIGY